MSLQSLCKSIETRVAKELALARSQDEKVSILTSALYEYGHSVFKALDSISPAKGVGTTGYLQAQSTASELLTFLVLPFIGSCSMYKQGVTVLNDLSAMCSDDSLRRRLVLYTNQLKRRWHQADPSALPINPRAARVLPMKKDPQLIETGALILLLLVVGGYFFTCFDLTSLIFPGRNAKPQLQQGKQGEMVGTENQIAPSPPSPVIEPQAQAPVPSGEYFSYTDAKGIVHLGNNPNNVSPRALPQVLQQAPQQPTPQVSQQPTQQVQQQVVQPVAQRRQVSTTPAASSGFPPPAVIDKVQKYDSTGLNEFESCRCRNGIATKGDQSKDVLQKCDQPVTTISTRTHDCGLVWLYNFGPNEFMQGVCFERGRVKKVLSLDYGY